MISAQEMLTEGVSQILHGLGIAVKQVERLSLRAHT